LQNDRAARFPFQYGCAAEYPEIGEPLIRLASASRNPSKPNKSAILEQEPSCSIVLQLAVKTAANTEHQWITWYPKDIFITN